MSESRKDLIRRLSQNGDIISLYRAGMLPDYIGRYRDIYYKLSELKATGIEKMVAVQQTCDIFNCSQATVYNAVTWMEG